MNLDKTLLNNIPGESENNSFRKTFAREEGRLIELIQVILEDIKIYFERFLMHGFCHGGQKQHRPRNITRCNVRMR